MKPIKLSAELEAVVGKGPLPRPQIVKKMWAYIKKEGLQDTKTKTNINLDETMKKALKSAESVISMFKMNALLKNGFVGESQKSKTAKKRTAKRAVKGSCSSYEPPTHTKYQRKSTGRHFCRKSRKKTN